MLLKATSARARRSEARFILVFAAWILFLGAVSAWFLFNTPVRAGLLDKDEKKEEKTEESEVDYLTLAALMIKDGHLDRAEAMLREVDESDPDLDRASFYTVRGLLRLYQELYVQAEEDLEKALAEGQDDPIAHLYLAQAKFGLDDYEGALSQLELAGEIARNMPGTYTIKAKCLWKLDRPAETFEVLDEGYVKFPEHHDFGRQQLMYMIEMGLYRNAVSEGMKYLQVSGAGSGDHVLIGEALRRSREFDKSLLFLEAAALKFPCNVEVKISLAHTYLDMGRPRTAAELFEQAASIDYGYIADAAELYRRAGDVHRALFLNSQIADQKKKNKQRLVLLLELGSFEQAASMEARLSRLGLLEDDSIRYALAYSLYKTGRFDEARRHLKKITSPELFKASSELVKAMDTCSQARWQCF